MSSKAHGPGITFGWRLCYRWETRIDGRLQRGTVSAVSQAAAEEAAQLRYCPMPGERLEVTVCEPSKSHPREERIAAACVAPSTPADALVAKTARSWIGWTLRQSVSRTGVNGSLQQCIEAGQGSGAARDAIFSVYRKEGVPIDELSKLASQFLEQRGVKE